MRLLHLLFGQRVKKSFKYSYRMFFKFSQFDALFESKRTLWKRWLGFSEAENKILPAKSVELKRSATETNFKKSRSNKGG